MVKPSPDIQNFEELPSSPLPPTPPTPPVRKRWWLLLLPAVILVLLSLAILFKLTPKPYPLTTSLTPTPTPPATVEETFNSPWATDSAVIQIESNLKTLETQLNTIDLKLTPLLPPQIQLKLEFDTQQ